MRFGRSMMHVALFSESLKNGRLAEYYGDPWVLAVLDKGSEYGYHLKDDSACRFLAREGTAIDCGDSILLGSIKKDYLRLYKTVQNACILGVFLMPAFIFL